MRPAAAAVVATSSVCSGSLLRLGSSGLLKTKGGGRKHEQEINARDLWILALGKTSHSTMEESNHSGLEQNPFLIPIL
jgi:aminopeptidase-like protein